jgi:hypothetical protein
MMFQRSLGIVIVPLLLIATFSAISLKLFIFETTAILKKENLKLHSEAMSLTQKISSISNVDTNTPFLFSTWQADSIGDASLNLQSSISKLAAKLGMPQHLLGPYSESGEESLMIFAVEFESETTLAKVAEFLTQIDMMDPMVSVAELDIRPITSYEPNVIETQVYLRVILQGGYDAPSK